jgi:hypothetical protein
VAGALLRKNVAPDRAVRLLGVSGSSLMGSGWQESLFEIDERRSLEKLYRGIDHLRDKYGESAIGAATPRAKTR